MTWLAAPGIAAIRVKVKNAHFSRITSRDVITRSRDVMVTSEICSPISYDHVDSQFVRIGPILIK